MLRVLERKGRCLLAHEMGLGKTVMALATTACYAQYWPVLVLAPPVLLTQWADEIIAWLPHLVDPSEVQIVKTGKSAVRDSAKFVLTTYAIVTGQTPTQRGRGRGRGSGSALLWSQTIGTERTNGQLRRRADGGPYQFIIADEVWHHTIASGPFPPAIAGHAE